jgi:hypothetical protein
MVDCAEFLESYSEFRDGLLPLSREGGFEAHRKACTSCARYDRVVGGGVQVFRSLPQLSPSPDFEARLRDRLWYLDRSSERHGSGASLAVTMLICMSIGLSAWLPTLRQSADPVRLPAVVAHAPYHDLNPVLLRSPAPGVSVIPVTTEAFYPQGLLLEPSGSSLTRLAFRPTATFHTPR